MLKTSFGPYRMTPASKAPSARDTGLHETKCCPYEIVRKEHSRDWAIFFPLPDTGMRALVPT